MKVMVPLGTRPEIIKLAPVIQALNRRGGEVVVVATGQHYDPSLSDAFYEALDVQVDVRWTLGGNEADRLGTMLSRAYGEVERARPDIVLVLGDTYTVPLFCLAARHYQVPVVHLEAGLRSFNEKSVEENNRRVASATASLHLAPTDLGARFLEAEGVPPERVHVVGNSVIDSIRRVGVVRVPPTGRTGAVVTAHRRTNVDDRQRLSLLVELLQRLANELAPVTFPVHPRTRIRLEEAGFLDHLAGLGIRLLPPLPYEDMLRLVSASRVVLTDSGGLQEEASWLGVPIVVLRHSTARWEGVRDGTSMLSGLNVETAMAAACRLSSDEEQRRVAAVPCPYGDGFTGERVADLLTDDAVLSLLRLEERSFVGADAPGIVE